MIMTIMVSIMTIARTGPILSRHVELLYCNLVFVIKI